MNERAYAEAVRDGRAPSPSKFGGAWYVALRISGTGIAERPAHGEVAYRDPSIWTAAPMLARASGLPVIAGHPEKAKLTPEEYASRNLGSIVLPYPKDGELWGVGRLHVGDEEAEALASGEFSTSPCAIFGPDDATAVQGTDSKLLIERDPSRLDHLAICGPGVWDRGGALNGIRADSLLTENKTMADEIEKKPEGDEKMDKVLEQLAAVCDMVKGVATRMDTFEAAAKEKPEEKADTVAPQKTLLEKTQENVEGDGDEPMADSQFRCDSVAIMHGMKAAPPMAGEAPFAYRLRLLKNFQSMSPSYAKADLKTIPRGPVFAAVEQQIYADAAMAANSPEVRPGVLSMRTKQLDTGHTVREFHGDIGTWMAPPFRMRGRIRSTAQVLNSN